MTRPTRIALSLAVLGSAVAASAALAASVPIYTNAMSSSASRGQLKTVTGKCKRGASGRALQVTVGKRTRECQLRTPVIGANLDISAVARLLAGTPKAMQKRVFVAVAVRDGGDGRYQLAVFPGKGRYQLLRFAPPDGTRTLLANGPESTIKGIGKPNKLRLQAFPTSSGQVRVTAFVNGKRIASVVEEAHNASTVSGRFSTFGVGSAKAAKGASASFDDLTVAVPDPF